jgi:Fic family protein
MSQITLDIISSDLLEQFVSTRKSAWKENFSALHDSELSVDAFSFYTSVSAVFSSKIEGEEIELDSYIKHKTLGTKYQPDYTQKIDDLYNAYQFAQQNRLAEENLERAHALLTQHILQDSQRGSFRKGKMYVISPDGKIEYVAASALQVESEMKRLYADLDLLIKTELSFDEVLYFAAMLHLVFVKIHPFEDGNGRTARLLEKWFLAEKLGEKAWFVQSEKMYYQRHQEYYTNIKRLGLEFDLLNYSEALPFLMMLPEGIC